MRVEGHPSTGDTLRTAILAPEVPQQLGMPLTEVFQLMRTVERALDAIPRAPKEYSSAAAGMDGRYPVECTYIREMVHDFKVMLRDCCLPCHGWKSTSLDWTLHRLASFLGLSQTQRLLEWDARMNDRTEDVTAWLPPDTWLQELSESSGSL